MIEIGKYHKLKVIKKLDFGIYLDGGNDEEILLPKAYIKNEINIGDFINVFIYRDSEDRLIATTLKPFAIVDEFAYLKVKSINKIGTFLDWGLPKDLLVPFREQKEKMVEGKYYLVKIYVDIATDRIVATANFRRFMSDDFSLLNEGQEVEILIFDKTEIGFNVIINSNYLGIIYKNEIFKRISIGDKTKGYIKKLREDGKIDISLQQAGYENIAEVVEFILNKLKSNNGVLCLSDKSNPKQIYSVLQISKKVFKKAIGFLYKEKKIVIKENAIELIINN